jgi:hypothetical protein
MFLVFWSCSDSGEPYINGCMDSTACNSNLDATYDDGSCTYPDDNYDCDNNCITSLDACDTCGVEIDDISNCCQDGQLADCTGTCGGDAENDDCGICSGDNSSCVNYSSEIQSIFNANCTSCHGGSHSTGLDLRSYEEATTGSNSGLVIIELDHSSSELWKKINSGSMPPSGSLTSDQINLIETWINEGALNN